MTDTVFLDFFARQAEPFYACIATKGYGVVRYVCDNDPVKCTNADEFGLAKKYRVPFALVWETYGNYAAYFTADQGRYDMMGAIRLARAMNYPEGKVIFLAVDTDLTADQAVEYFNAAYLVLKDDGFAYTLGVYGGHKVTGANWPAVAFRWQTVAWSYGVIDAADNLYQYAQQTICGVDCDLNQVTGDLNWAVTEDDLSFIDDPAAVAYREDVKSTFDAIKAVDLEYRADVKTTFEAIKTAIADLAHHSHIYMAKQIINDGIGGRTSEPLEPPVPGAAYFSSDDSLEVIGWTYPDGVNHFFRNGVEITQ